MSTMKWIRQQVCRVRGHEPVLVEQHRLRWEQGPTFTLPESTLKGGPWIEHRGPDRSLF